MPGQLPSRGAAEAAPGGEGSRRVTRSVNEILAGKSLGVPTAQQDGEKQLQNQNSWGAKLFRFKLTYKTIDASA